jgi:hypothetical protein
MNTRSANKTIQAIQGFLNLKAPMAQLIMGIFVLLRTSIYDSIHGVPNHWSIDDTKLIYVNIVRLGTKLKFSSISKQN